MVQLLALVVWVGGLIFFAFVLAPVAFHTLPSSHEAGLVVGAALRELHAMGLVAGFAYLSAAVGARQPRRWWLGPVMVAGMMMLTAVSQWSILPRMERDRAAAGGDVAAVDLSDPARADFDHLHRLSERVEGAVLVLGLATTVLMGLDAGKRTGDGR